MCNSRTSDRGIRALGRHLPDNNTVLLQSDAAICHCNLSLLLACQPGCLCIALVEKLQGLCPKLAASRLRRLLHSVLPSVCVPSVLSTHPAVLRPLSTGDIIGFYNTLIIPAAKDYLHAMVDGKTPLHPPPGLLASPCAGI